MNLLSYSNFIRPNKRKYFLRPRIHQALCHIQVEIFFSRSFIQQTYNNKPLAKMIIVISQRIFYMIFYSLKLDYLFICIDSFYSLFPFRQTKKAMLLNIKVSRSKKRENIINLLYSMHHGNLGLLYIQYILQYRVPIEDFLSIFY